jgi:hypothetical protein
MPRIPLSRFWNRFGILISVFAVVINGCGEGDPFQPSDFHYYCTTDSGAGTLNVNITGLPAGLDAKVSLSGPGGEFRIPSSHSFSNLQHGQYTLASGLVVQPDSLVRGVYTTGNPFPFCFSDTTTANVQFAYQLMPASNKAWLTTSAGNGVAGLYGFASSQLGTGADVEPLVSLTVPGLRSHQAFTADGILVSTRGHGIQTLQALTAFPLGEIRLSNMDIDSIDCEPDDIAIVNGFLHIAVACEKTIYAFRYDEYCCAPGILNQEFLRRIPMGVVSIAYDKRGDLWVATGEGHILWYRDSELYSQNPTFTLAFPSPSPGGTPLDPTGLAFDAEGSLWAYDRGGQGVFAVSPADLGTAGVKSLLVKTILPGSIGTLRGKLAFDGSGGLWVSGSGGFARLSPAQLKDSSQVGGPVVPERIFSSGSRKQFDNLLFFPPAANLPLPGAQDYP